jgi:hypothetical protein
MVYMTPGDLGWKNYVDSWIEREFKKRADGKE